MEDTIKDQDPTLNPSAKVAAGPLEIEINKDDTFGDVSILVGAVLILYLGIRLIKKYI